MRLHAYQGAGGELQIVAAPVDAHCAEVTAAADLGEADVDLAALSPSMVLGLGMDARAVARGNDAHLIRRALATQQGA